MALFTDVEDQVAALRGLFGDDVPVDALAARMSQFGGDKLVNTLQAASALARSAERISIVGAGLVAARSSRTAGQNGLAQGRGHRTPAALVQETTGVGYGEAQRQVRLGLAILESDAARRDQDVEGHEGSPSWGAEDGRREDGSADDDAGDSSGDDAAGAGGGRRCRRRRVGCWRLGIRV